MVYEALVAYPENVQPVSGLRKLFTRELSTFLLSSTGRERGLDKESRERGDGKKQKALHACGVNTPHATIFRQASREKGAKGCARAAVSRGVDGGTGFCRSTDAGELEFEERKKGPCRNLVAGRDVLGVEISGHRVHDSFSVHSFVAEGGATIKRLT